MKLTNHENIELIIFDCDGVLIDSEIISANIMSQQFNKLSINISSEYIQNNFIGHSYIKVKEKIQERFDIALKDDFEEEYRVELLKAFDNELKIIPGIEHILQNLNIAKCVATSSSQIRAQKSLTSVGIYKYLQNNIFSAYNLGPRGKPKPDIYLNAAKKFNIEPKNVLVIEDSLLGIQGAITAGMKTWHFTGATHMKSWDITHKYEFEPDFVFNDMSKFFAYLPQLKNGETK